MRRACITLVACSVLAVAAAACGGAGASPSSPAPVSAAPSLAASEAPPASAAPSASDDGSEYPSREPGTPAAAGGCTPVDGAGTTTVDIADFAFAPATVTIRAGESVTWTNGDAAPHTATVGSIAGCTTGTIGQNGAATLRFDTPGTYAYACAIHPAMTGTVEVGG